MAGNDSYTKLLIHSDDTDGAVAFTDSSSSGHSIAVTGNVHHETDQQVFGASSIQFDGTTDNLTIISSTDFDLGTDDFTIDMWIRMPTGIATNPVLMQREGTGGSGQSIYLLLFSNQCRFTLGSGQINRNWTYTVDTWYHLACVRSSGEVTIYIDGTALGASETITGDISSDQVMYIGGSPVIGAPYYHTGFIDELRISKGIARWVGSFTPPTEAYSPPILEMDFASEFVLGATVDANQGSTIEATFALGGWIDAGWSGISIGADFVLGAEVTGNIPKVGEIESAFVFNSIVEASSNSAITVNGSFVLSATVTADIIAGNSIETNFVLGGSVEAYLDKQDITIDASFVFGADVTAGWGSGSSVPGTPETPCAIVEHSSARWS